MLQEGREGQLLLACPPLQGLADSEAKGVRVFPPMHVLLGKCPPALSWACCRPGSPEAVPRGWGGPTNLMPGRFLTWGAGSANPLIPGLWPPVTMGHLPPLLAWPLGGNSGPL